MTKQYNQKQFRKSIDEHFNEEELQILCADLDVDYEHLDGKNKLTKVHSLVRSLYRHNRLDALYEKCKEDRSNVDWESVKSGGSSFISISTNWPEIGVGLFVTAMILGIIFIVFNNNRTDPCRNFYVGDLVLAHTLIETDEEVDISIYVDNPEKRTLIFDWFASAGEMTPGLGSQSAQSQYKAPSEVGTDAISVQINIAGCKSVKRTLQVFVAEATMIEHGSLTVTSTARIEPTKTTVPTKTPTHNIVSMDLVTSTPDAMCLQTPGSRWGDTLWPIYQEQLGCALVQERRIPAAYQPFEHGIVIWRDQSDVSSQLLYLLYDDGTYEEHPVKAPEGFHDSLFIKGAIGYLWKTNIGIQEKIGEPLDPENNATEFAIQEFLGGVIFYFLENEAHNYVLQNETNTWEATQD